MREIARRDAVERGANLASDEILRLTGFVDRQAFTHGDDRVKAMLERRLHFLVHHLIGDTLIRTGFGVSDDNIFYQTFEHSGSHLAGIGSLLFPVDVLRADFDVGAFKCLFDAQQCDVRRANNALRRFERDQSIFDGIYKCNGFLGRFVHFPVTGDDRSPHGEIPS